MKFSAAALLATLAATVVASPIAESERIAARTEGVKCCKTGGQWHYGWGGSKPEEQYICSTIGLLNLLNCVAVLNGNSVEVPISIILGPLLG